MSSDPLGVLIAGLGGCTGSTFALAVEGMKAGLLEEEAGITDVGEHWPRFIGVGDIAIGGWDLTDESLLDRATHYDIISPTVLVALRDAKKDVRPMIGVTYPSDYIEGPPAESSPKTLDAIRHDIRRFRSQSGVNRCVLVSLLPPEPACDPDLVEQDLPTLLKTLLDGERHRVRSSLVYTAAALLEGCAVIDFTPNAALEIPVFNELAVAKGVPIAGRDGSTGQTILKTHLAELFRARNLVVDGWYSTNILGNSDGAALMDPARRRIKMRDKLDGLGQVLGYEVANHVVTIDYYRPRGDDKESWDAVDLRGWLGSSMQLKLNWQGRDSLLAGSLLLDLVRLIATERVWQQVGIVPELGYFFKHPLGTEERSPSALLRTLYELWDGSPENGER